MIKKFSDLPREIQDKCIAEVIARVEDIESESVGVIAAQELIDIVASNMGPVIYNVALRDVKKLLTEKMMDIEVEINQLEQTQ
jgi:uncharacterized protein (DUF2164 family)